MFDNFITVNYQSEALVFQKLERFVLCRIVLHVQFWFQTKFLKMVDETPSIVQSLLTRTCVAIAREMLGPRCTRICVARKTPLVYIIIWLVDLDKVVFIVCWCTLRDLIVCVYMHIRPLCYAPTRRMYSQTTSTCLWVRLTSLPSSRDRLLVEAESLLLFLFHCSSKSWAKELQSEKLSQKPMGCNALPLWPHTTSSCILGSRTLVHRHSLFATKKSHWKFVLIFVASVHMNKKILAITDRHRRRFQKNKIYPPKAYIRLRSTFEIDKSLPKKQKCEQSSKHIMMNPL